MQKDLKLNTNKTDDLTYDTNKMASLRVKTANLKNILPLYHSSDVISYLREDILTNFGLSQREALFNSKSVKGNYFLTLKTF